MKSRSHLLDTNVLIFFLENSPRLPTSLAELIEDSSTRSHVSLASLWEIAIKASLGKLHVDYADRADLPDILVSMGFHILTPSWDTMRMAAYLPLYHRDPFDRLLIAECQARDVPLLSCDSQLDAYGIKRIW